MAESGRAQASEPATSKQPLGGKTPLDICRPWRPLTSGPSGPSEEIPAAVADLSSSALAWPGLTWNLRHWPPLPGGAGSRTGRLGVV